MWGDKLANRGGAAALTGMLATAGFPAKHVALGHLLELLYITAAVDLSCLDLRAGQRHRRAADAADRVVGRVHRRGPSVVYGYEELREKIVAADARLNDALVEAFKLELLTACAPRRSRRGSRRAAGRKAVGAEAECAVIDGVEREQRDAAARQLRLAGYARARRARRDRARQLPCAVRGVYVNVQRYRFELLVAAEASVP